MRARAATIGTLVALVGFGAGGSFAVAGEFTPKGKDRAAAQAAPTPEPTSPGQSQYGTRPGKGCGDKNHVHTGPPGNPNAKPCPAQSGQKKSGTRKSASTKRKSSCANSQKAKGKNKKANGKNKKASKRSKSKSCKRASAKSKSKKNKARSKKRSASRG